ncbi:MAG TPA: CPBP family glutamic-type intramembrane protease [Pseudomonadales bacterium]|nr:CPBP family glutamic-type intramembrane protease [Pseudomonadales bacterium]
MIANTIRRLPVPAEFCLVIFVCFWWGIYSSIMVIAMKATGQPQQSIVGIGIFLAVTNNEPVITEVAPNTPAAQAGLSPGLIIQKIDGTSADGMNVQDCINRIHGAEGSQVRLQLFDPTENLTNTVTLSREKIPVFTGQVYFIDKTAVRIVCHELLGLAATFWIARIRGWPLGTWGFKFSWKQLGGAVLMYLVIAMVIWPIALAANHVSPGIVHRHFESHVSLPWLIVLVCLNPFFEETMELGYFVQTLKRYGIWVTVLASALFRAFLHAYQGIDAVLIIFPLGVLFGLIYWRWRCLWPLFIVHAVMDFGAFLHR